MPKTPAHLQASPSFQLWQLNHHWQKELHKALSEAGLTYTEFVVLAALFHDWQWQTSSQARLARHSNLDKMVVSQTLASLQKKHLVRRRTNPIDKRNLTLRLSGQGTLVAEQTTKIVEAIDQRLAASLVIADLPAKMGIALNINLQSPT
jgi:DNA-binding MarR family transcriptional regulator